MATARLRLTLALFKPDLYIRPSAVKVTLSLAVIYYLAVVLSANLAAKNIVKKTRFLLWLHVVIKFFAK